MRAGVADPVAGGVDEEGRLLWCRRQLGAAPLTFSQRIHRAGGSASCLDSPNFDSRMVSGLSVNDMSVRSSRMASPTRMPVTTNSPMRLS